MVISSSLQIPLCPFVVFLGSVNANHTLACKQVVVFSSMPKVNATAATSQTEQPHPTSSNKGKYTSFNLNALLPKQKPHTEKGSLQFCTRTNF